MFLRLPLSRKEALEELALALPRMKAALPPGETGGLREGRPARPRPTSGRDFPLPRLTEASDRGPEMFCGFSPGMILMETLQQKFFWEIARVLVWKRLWCWKDQLRLNPGTLYGSRTELFLL